MQRGQHRRRQGSPPTAQAGVEKIPSGIEGFDQLTGGGLPRGRTTLVLGGPGAGKTLFCLQALLNGATALGEPGLFVAFEEHSERVLQNVASFGWISPGRQGRLLEFADIHHDPGIMVAGGFDLEGLLAVLDEKLRRLGARRIVLDAVDVLLDLLGGPEAKLRELHRLNGWLARRELTALITAKTMEGDPWAPMSRIQFMVDCAVQLDHVIEKGVSQRSLRVVKYRGSAHAENEAPMLIGPRGLEVAGLLAPRPASGPATRERISTGVHRLDAMLEGGYFRGASVLLTGAPGTAKTTLAGAFVEAACTRGERALFVSFDSDHAELTRNLTSVGIRLARFVKSGLLRLVSSSAGGVSAEAHFLRIRAAAREHEARCVVIDPVSALLKQGNELTAHGVVERLSAWARSERITLLCTSLGPSGAPDQEATAAQISTLADTWIHLSYVAKGGERNRALTIVKSRGMAHSAQVRELVLERRGIRVEDVYTAGGEVLMGTRRWEREQAESAAQAQLAEQARSQLNALEAGEAELEARLEALERELAQRRTERKALLAAEAERTSAEKARTQGLARRRGGGEAAEGRGS